MKRNYSPNHPAVRSYIEDNYQPTIKERREAVRQRVGSRENPKLVWTVFGVSFFLGMGLVEKATGWALPFIALMLLTLPTVLERIDR